MSANSQSSRRRLIIKERMIVRLSKSARQHQRLKYGGGGNALLKRRVLINSQRSFGEKWRRFQQAG